jgi:hypothetical protein
MHISQTEIQSRSTAAGDNDRIGVLVIQYIRNPMSRLFHKAVVPQPEHPSLAVIYRELWPSPAPYFLGVNQFPPASATLDSIWLT